MDNGLSSKILNVYSYFAHYMSLDLSNKFCSAMSIRKQKISFIYFLHNHLELAEAFFLYSCF
jgi:hypothetical protein